MKVERAKRTLAMKKKNGDKQSAVDVFWCTDHKQLDMRPRDKLIWIPGACIRTKKKKHKTLSSSLEFIRARSSSQESTYSWVLCRATSALSVTSCFPLARDSAYILARVLPVEISFAQRDLISILARAPNLA